MTEWVSSCWDSILKGTNIFNNKKNLEPLHHRLRELKKKKVLHRCVKNQIKQQHRATKCKKQEGKKKKKTRGFSLTINITVEGKESTFSMPATFCFFQKFPGVEVPHRWGNWTLQRPRSLLKSQCLVNVKSDLNPDTANSGFALQAADSHEGFLWLVVGCVPLIRSIRPYWKRVFRAIVFVLF